MKFDALHTALVPYGTLRGRPGGDVRGGSVSAEPRYIGAYRIEKSIGRGGMGEVFLAWDDRLGRHVAIKRIREDRGLDAVQFQRFRREARAVAQLSHPAIVQIFDLLEAEEDPRASGSQSDSLASDSIVMEWVEGHSLSELTRDGGLDLDLALGLAAEIADGLAEAHGKGFVHRDLKPPNIMVTHSGHAKILDFGLARSLPQQEDLETLSTVLTQSGALVGTIHAMSPEQASGQDVDHRSDLFALGSLIYEMLTGQSPFLGTNNLQTLQRVVCTAHEPISMLAPHVPREVCDLVDTLLEKDPNHRPQSTRRVADRLRQLATGSGSLPLPSDSTLVGSREDSVTQIALDTQATLDQLTAIQPAPLAAVIRILVLTELVDPPHSMETLGGERASNLASKHDRFVRDVLARHNGLEVEKTHAFLMLFERPGDAIAYALAYHQGLEQMSQMEGLPLAARVGIHLGEVFLRRNPERDVVRGAKPLEVEGLAKPIVARLGALAGARQTLLTQGVFELARRASQSGLLADPALGWVAHGQYLLEDLEEPIEVFEVGLQDFAPLAPPTDIDGARRATQYSDELTLGWRPAVGQVIPHRDHWTLDEQLGVGGFGEVWLASHKSGEQRVFKFCFEGERLRSLKREVTLFRLLREALGHRDDIARILDWNFEQAPFFLEAEYSGSGSLEQWADEQGGIAEVPLGVRLELVAQAADALAAAHSVGVLHKDVKPENVLISKALDGSPRVRLTDFGIGRLTDTSALSEQNFTVLGMTALTEDSEGAGTRLYMAPELLEGKPATVQADIYSLGVVLYQMVAGDLSRALATGWRRDIDDPLLMDDIACFVDGDPENRPSSIAEVAQRLRSLETRRQELEAQERAKLEEAAALRALEKAQRRRRLYSMTTAITSFVLALVSIFAWQALQARRESDRARETAEAARQEAEQRRGQAEGLIRFVINDLQPQLTSLGRLDILGPVSDAALDYFDAVPEDLLTEGELHERIKAIQVLGSVRMSSGKIEESLGVYQKALELAEALASRDPNQVEWQRLLGVSHFWVGSVYYRQGDLEKALDRFESQLSIQQKALVDRPDDGELEQEISYALSNVGFVRRARGDLEGALDAFLETLAIKERHTPEIPTNPNLQLQLAEQYKLVGVTQMELGLLDAALHNLQISHSMTSQMATELPGNTQWTYQLAIVESRLSQILQAKGPYEESWETLDTARSHLASLVANDPENIKWAGELAMIHLGLGFLALEGPRPSLATEHSMEAKRLLRLATDRSPADIEWQRALARNEILQGTLSGLRKHFDQALNHGRAAQKILDQTLEQAPNHRQTRRWLAEAQLLMGRAMAAQGSSDSAFTAWHRAVETLEPISASSRDWIILRPWLQALEHTERHQEASDIKHMLENIGYAYSAPEAWWLQG